MFSGFDVSKYANPVFGPHLFFVSRGVDQKTCSDRLQELCHEVTVAGDRAIRNGLVVSQFSCKERS